MTTEFENAPAGKRLVFCRAYRNKWSGKLMVAAHYGKEAWAFWVADKSANDNRLEDKSANDNRLEDKSANDNRLDGPQSGHCDIGSEKK